MKVVKPYIDENKQVIFVEFENQTIQDLVNGFILGIIVFLPISLTIPRPI